MSDSEPRQPRPARADKIRRKTRGALSISRPVEEQRAGFEILLQLTHVGVPEHACATIEPEAGTLGPRGGLRITPREALGDGAGGALERLFYLHGGGYSLGSPETHRPLAARLAHHCGAEVWLPRYGLAPERPCPAGLGDALAAWRAFPEEERRRTVVAGDSAGGGLALALVLALRDAGEVLPAGVVLLSPWTDLTLSGASIDELAEREVMLHRRGLEYMARAYAGALPLDDVRVSPHFADFRGLPPLLIQVGGYEVLLDDARRAAARAEAAGVAVELQIWDEQIHVFQATPFIEAGHRALSKIAAWVVTIFAK